jgi:glycosyltransferase involved in cell wall biosynthesis
MNNKAKVSIITPFLNAGRYIEETILSVLAQTYDHWELLLADDGSTDQGTDIARRYASLYPDKVRYLEHENHRHGGESATRNLALRNATGRYIAFVDADDVWEPFKLEEQVAIIESQPEAGMIYGRALVWHSWTGKPEDLERDCPTDLGVPPEALYQPPSLLLLLLQGKKVVPSPCSVMARRETIERVGGFADDFPDLFDDMVFYAKMFLAAPVFVSGGCSAKYRQHESMSTTVAFQKGEWHPYQPNPAQRKFLTWLENYLTEKAQAPSEVWKILQKELWPYRHPVLYRLQGRLARLAGRAKWLCGVATRWLKGQSVGFITASPNPIEAVEGPALGVTTLTWKARRTTRVEVRVGTPDGPLLSQSAGAGTTVTGRWVFDGEIFYLQDVSEGRPLSKENTLASVTVKVVDRKGEMNGSFART